MYTVDIDNRIESLTHCLQMVENGINDIWDWSVSINAGRIDCGIYFNFDLERKELEISNQPRYGYDDSLGLSEIIDVINEEGEDDEE